MKQKLESIINKGKMLALAGLICLTPLKLSSQSLKHYIEPRAGTIAPVTEKEQAYDSSFLIGGAYGLSIGKFTLEIGLDQFKSSGEYIKTKSLLPRLNISYSPFKQTAEVKPYLMTGVNFLRESSTIDIPEFNVHDEVSNTTFGLEFGVGATISDRIHGRISYTVMPGSENVKGMVTLTCGYRFRF
jgi:hypothetical protein